MEIIKFLYECKKKVILNELILIMIFGTVYKVTRNNDDDGKIVVLKSIFNSKIKSPTS